MKTKKKETKRKKSQSLWFAQKIIGIVVSKLINENIEAPGNASSSGDGDTSPAAIGRLQKTKPGETPLIVKQSRDLM